MPDGGPLLREPDAGVMTLPNVITFARLCAVPMAVWLVLHADMDAAFWLFAAAGVSDAVDGWLARRGRASRLGALMDPAADKALLVTMYVTLAAMRALPDWLAILVVFRDAIIVGGLIVLWATGHDVPIRPLPISKVNTVLQILVVGTALLLAAGRISAGPAYDMLLWTAAASTLASGAAYVWQAARR